jgi:antitoxin (DNA-binding transcriptional repressor) of toxin-antitoxin stability system
LLANPVVRALISSALGQLPRPCDLCPSACETSRDRGWLLIRSAPVAASHGRHGVSRGRGQWCVRAGQTVRITVAGATVLTLALAAERRPQRAATVRRSAVIRPDFVEENLGTLTADPMRLRQILLNLLSNACKFTKRGEVKLKAKGVTNGGNWIELADCDTEIGMTPEQTGEAVRGIHSGRFVDRAAFRGHGTRPCHLPQARAHDGWRRDGGKRSGQGIGIYGAPTGSDRTCTDPNCLR